MPLGFICFNLPVFELPEVKACKIGIIKMQNDHLNLLCTVNEISAMLAGSDDLDTFLQSIVDTVSDHIRSEVCSIYMHDEQNSELYLKATKGLHPDSVNHVRMSINEGLVGLCLKEKIAIRESKASSHPHFKPFTGIDEERFESFLAVPIARGNERIGVLVVQRETVAFNNFDERALQATASQLAGAIENARVLLLLKQTSEPQQGQSELKLIKGQVASEGVVVAPIYIFTQNQKNPLSRIYPGEENFDLKAFNRAVRLTNRQISALEKRLEKKLPEMASLIFGAHQMILMDPQFIGKMRGLIKKDKNAAQAIREVSSHYIDIFRNNPNAYMREKVSDIEDLAKRLLNNLTNTKEEDSSESKGKIIIANDLYPSDLLKLSSEGIGGIILCSGGVTSHVSILARSMDIPMIIANEPQLLKIENDQQAILDAEVGNIYLNPTSEILASCEQRTSCVKLEAERIKDKTTLACFYQIK